MRVLFLEPFYGGSHRDFADNLRSHSAHTIDLATLPARFWKWRMRGAALHFAHTIPWPEGYDAIIATNLMSLSDLTALWRHANARPLPPILLYMHENQLSYPLPAGERMDYHFGFTDITSCLAADRICFNSRTHLRRFFDHIGPFMARMPEHRPKWVTEEIRSRSTVLYPGYHSLTHANPLSAERDDIPLIVWNHRWEFDKRPEAFFSATDALDDMDMHFNLALLGENFQIVPKPFLAARERYGDRVLRYGYEESRSSYEEWLLRGWVVVSTAVQENFGISMVEAAAMGCVPLAPARLCYPEIIPREIHEHCLYRDDTDLVTKLSALIGDPVRLSELRAAVVPLMEPFAWQRRIEEIDRALGHLVAGTFP